MDQAALAHRGPGPRPRARRARDLDDFGDVEIALWPDWVTTIPKRADRITFTLGEPQPSASPAP